MLNLKSGAKAKDIALACGAELIYEGNKDTFDAVIDSRAAKDGVLFVAIKGERTNGHLYIASAAENGASAVLVEEDVPCLEPFIKNNCSVLRVQSTSLALAHLSKFHKAEMSAITVGVTGSVGKTTTRQYIASVLSSKYRTHKTEGNFNNELGLPLTLLSLTPNDQASVIEMGMGQRGDISFLSQLCMPDIAVITTIGSSHIEHLGSREAIAEAKLEVLDGLKDGGKLILNGDEVLLSGIDNAIYVSLHNESSDYRGTNIKYSINGMAFDAICPNRIISDCLIPTLGDHTVLDAIYAVAVGDILGLNDEEIKRGLNEFKGVGMRQNIVEKDGITYIHDYYNASPESIKASLKVTKNLAKDMNGRAVGVIGSVLELGELSEVLHRSIGTFIAENDIDLLFTFGDDASFIADEAIKNGFDENKVRVFKDITDPKPISEAINKEKKVGDCILIKASHGIEMGRIAELL